MAPWRLWALVLVGLGTVALGKEEATSISTTSTSDDGVVVLTGTHTSSEPEPPTPTPTSLPGTTTVVITLASTTIIGTGIETATDNVTEVEITVTSGTLTYLTGSIISATPSSSLPGNFSTTSTSTSTGPTVTNTQPCNNYVELCERRYSNITQIGAHNSPFVSEGSVAANQALDVTDQLNDGVRFLQGQIHWPTNDTVPHFCHTTCDLFDGGPITDWLGKIVDWVAANRFDVVTILLGNGNYSTPDFYVPYINQTGLLNYVYTPPYQPMNYTAWPTLAEMIIYNTRVVVFLDYMANQTAYPWLIDEFSNMWETPFDPTDQTFPCTIQRPGPLSHADATNRLYLTNHNLNAEVSVLGTSILVPDVTNLNTTNNVTGFGSLGVTAAACTSDWGRPPNVLNVDYYNYGGAADSGAVFQVAAAMNNVTYRGGCCGNAVTSGAESQFDVGRRMTAVCLTVISAWFLLV
ncbi:unnamed protein product [Discula destructiva]